MSGVPLSASSPIRLLLVAQPGVLGLLVDVHRAAEDHRGAVAVERRGGRPLVGGPLDELVPGLARRLAEYSGAGFVFVDDGEYTHGRRSLKRSSAATGM